MNTEAGGRVASSIDYWQQKGHKLHYRTQDGQSYGSESRKCAMCGVMIWPEVQGAKTPEHTDNLTEYSQSPYRCNKS